MARPRCRAPRRVLPMRPIVSAGRAHPGVLKTVGHSSARRAAPPTRGGVHRAGIVWQTRNQDKPDARVTKLEKRSLSNHC
jgi:hypothetical protein